MNGEKIKVLVVYDSWTGNVERMAKAVAEGAVEEGAEVKVVKVDEVNIDEVPIYDGYAFGSPTHCGTMSYKMNYFFNKQLIKYWGKLRYKVAVAFTSSGGLSGGNEMA
ncbi:MAG: flavodoxin domain-containing protein [Thermofilaceae archaeon]